jgi:hypothetical protein
MGALIELLSVPTEVSEIAFLPQAMPQLTYTAVLFVITCVVLLTRTSVRRWVVSVT